jgi:hypothetical protein
MFSLVLASCLAAISADPSRSATQDFHRATSHKLANAIDTYQKAIEAAEQAKVDAGHRLVESYEASIKRAMRSGDLKTVDELQAELKLVRTETEKESVSSARTASQSTVSELRKTILATRWSIFWNMKKEPRSPCTFFPDGTAIFSDSGTKRTWKIEWRPALIIDPMTDRGPEDVLFFLKIGEFRGFFAGDGRPMGAFPIPRSP